ASLRVVLRPGVFWANILANASLTLFLYSVARLPLPAYATLGFYTAPLWTAVVARSFAGERMGLGFLPAAAGLLGGGYLALFGWSAPDPGVDRLGLALAIGSGLVWGIYSVVLRKAAPEVPLKPLLGASFL